MEIIRKIIMTNITITSDCQINSFFCFISIAFGQITKLGHPKGDVVSEQIIWVSQ
jgi:hypothetical protein